MRESFSEGNERHRQTMTFTSDRYRKFIKMWQRHRETGALIALARSYAPVDTRGSRKILSQFKFESIQPARALGLTWSGIPSLETLLGQA